MLQSLTNLLAGFLTWQTPFSFLAGVGVYHLYCRSLHKGAYASRREGSVYTENRDGSFRFSNRFWVYTIIASVIICYIGWRTQDTADRVENQSMLTRDCLTQVISALQVARSVAQENDNLSERQRDAYNAVVTAMVAPPPELAALPYSDQRRTDYIADVAIKQLPVIQEVEDDQKENSEYRAQHPYPDPDCAILD